MSSLAFDGTMIVEGVELSKRREGGELTQQPSETKSVRLYRTEQNVEVRVSLWPHPHIERGSAQEKKRSTYKVDRHIVSSQIGREFRRPYNMYKR